MASIMVFLKSKFLVNKIGEVVNRYGPSTKGEDIESDIIALLS